MSDERKVIIDKMTHGVSRLPPIAHDLYFSLCEEFQKRHKGATIKTSLRQYLNNNGIKIKEITDAIAQIKCAFDEIHQNTFHKYDYIIESNGEDENDIGLVISRIDNIAEIRRIMDIIKEDTPNEYTCH